MRIWALAAAVKPAPPPPCPTCHCAGAVMERTLLPVDLAALSSFEARQFVNLNPLFAPIQVASSGLAVPHPEKVGGEGGTGWGRPGRELGSSLG